MNAQVGAENLTYRDENRVAGLEDAALDFRQVAVVNPGRRSQLSDRKAGVDPQSLDLESEAPSCLGGSPPYERPPT
ncbi:MAG TPA: hypothetical protein VFV72_01550 [Candidatus Limnocylindrales bacterium]|nr:hypothetical protein [Candidatus Limnocylindrales bacterium]